MLGRVERMRFERRRQRLAEAAQRLFGQRGRGRLVVGREPECARAAHQRPQVAPLEAHVGVVPQHQPARRVVGHAAEQRLRQRQVARGVGAPRGDDALHRAQVVVARHVVREPLFLQGLQAAPRLLVVAEPAPQHRLVERDQRALEVGGGQRAGERIDSSALGGWASAPLPPLLPLPATGAISRPCRAACCDATSCFQNAASCRCTASGGGEPVACALRARSPRNDATSRPWPRGRPPAHARAGPRPPAARTAPAAPLGIQEAGLAQRVLAPADLDVPALKSRNARLTTMRSVLASDTSPRRSASRTSRAGLVGMQHAHQQPERLKGRAPAVDRLRRGEFDGKKSGLGHAPN